MYITNLATAVTVQDSSLYVYWEGLEEKAIFGSLIPRPLTAVEKNRFFSTAARSNLGVAWGRGYIFGDLINP